MVLAVFFEPDAAHQVDLTDADLARVFGGGQLVVAYADGHPAARTQRALVFVECEHPFAFGRIPFGFRRVAGDAPMPVPFHPIRRFPAEPTLVADAELLADSQFPYCLRIIREADSSASFGSMSFAFRSRIAYQMGLIWPSDSSVMTLASSSTGVSGTVFLTMSLTASAQMSSMRCFGTPFSVTVFASST